MAAETMSKLVKANTTFALNLYKEVVKGGKPDSNVFCSPFSISSALSMTSLGARENTVKEMKQTLGFAEMSDEELHSSYADYNSKLMKADAPYTLKTANRLFARKDYNFLEDFLAATKKHYAAEAQTLDFAGNAEESRVAINKWVEDQTAQKIQNLLSDGTIDSQTALVLVNAIYFKGNWADKFDKRGTHSRTFLINDEETTEVDYMFKSAHFNIGSFRDLDSKIIEIPYENKDLSFIVILPNKSDGLADLENKITTEHFESLSNPKKLASTKIEFYMPKFKLEAGFNLNDTLTTLGMNDIFAHGKADLSGIDGTKELFVSNVVHKAFIEVNEEGSEAAAATAVQISLMCMPDIVEVVVQHPFMFCIRDNTSGGILFMGRYARPPQV